jgi:hypothetical protein
MTVIWSNHLAARHRVKHGVDVAGQRGRGAAAAQFFLSLAAHCKPRWRAIPH